MEEGKREGERQRQGTRNEKQGTRNGNREQGTENVERRMGNEERGTRNVKNVEQGTGTGYGERVKRYGE